jgi:hypothetical protein
LIHMPPSSPTICHYHLYLIMQISLHCCRACAALPR